MANGPSVPSVEVMTRNVEHLGHTHNIDRSLLPEIAEHFERVAGAAGFSVGVPQEYDLFSVRHQVPGGMMGTLKAQLVQHEMADRLDDVLEETGRVRRELGYPGMATPFSQLVGTLAVLNIVSGERYAVIPDEVIQYAGGHYGEPVAPIDPKTCWTGSWPLRGRARCWPSRRSSPRSPSCASATAPTMTTS